MPTHVHAHTLTSALMRVHAVVRGGVAGGEQLLVLQGPARARVVAPRPETRQSEKCG
jgi:hypothetical protein